MALIIYLLCVTPLLLVVMLLVLIYLLSNEMPSPKTLFLTLGRDLRTAYLHFKIRSFIKKCRLHDKSLTDHFRSNVEKRRHKTCFIFQDQKWTYQMVDELSNKVANYFVSCGYSKGDEVALMLDNCPEYASIWLGLAKIGVVTALINTNLKGNSLGHSINYIDFKAIIFGRNFSETMKDVKPSFSNRDRMEYFCFTQTGASTDESVFLPAQSLNMLLEEASSSPIDPQKHKVGFNDKLFYIYTSGTSGLPKAVIIRHSRSLWVGAITSFALRMGDSAVVYNPLPMYHLSGGLFLLSMVLMFGGTMILRKKFSASNYWKEASKYKATVGQHIGEICRYLLNQPVTEEEKQHCIKLMIGNGLKPLIWKQFQERFRIKNIIECYGATEGYGSLMNLFGKVGAVGFLPRFCDRYNPVSLVRVDPESREILRDEKGLCIRCRAGEPGELVGKITSNAIRSFDGYANQNETKKKIIRNCFEKGDMSFRSGDILVMDEEGYLFFVDRTGDTFRWQGENVSTTEVENILSEALDQVPCVVYGVEIPNIEGRAGMAAFQINPKLDGFSELYKNVSKRLPSYAIPLFLRLSKQIEETGTHKLRKETYRKEGFNPSEIQDPLFFLDIKEKNYIPLTKELYSDIVAGKLRL